MIWSISVLTETRDVVTVPLHWGQGGNLSNSKQSVHETTIGTVGTAWHALGMISGGVSRIPLNCYRVESETERVVDTGHAAQPLVSIDGMSNDEDTALQLWRKVVFACALYGQTFVWIRRGDGGRPNALFHLLPDRTHVDRSLVTGRKFVRTTWRDPMREPRQQIFDYDDVLHIEGPSMRDNAPDAIRRIREAIGTALARQEFEARYFGQGGHQGGILHIPTGAPERSREKVQRDLIEKAQNPDLWFETAILRDGYKFETIASTIRETQMSENKSDDAREIARFFMIHPSLLGVPGTEGYNSREAARRDLHETTFGWYTSSILAQCNAKLRSTRQRTRRTHIFDYSIATLNFADVGTMAEVVNKGVLGGWMTADEARRPFGLNALPDGAGAQVRVPLNTTTPSDEEPQQDEQEAQEPTTQDESANRSDVHVEQRKAHLELFRSMLQRIARRLIQAHSRGKLLDGPSQRRQLEPCTVLVSEVLPVMEVMQMTKDAVTADAVAMAAVTAAARAAEDSPDMIEQKLLTHCESRFLR